MFGEVEFILQHMPDKNLRFLDALLPWPSHIQKEYQGKITRPNFQGT